MRALGSFRTLLLLAPALLLPSCVYQPVVMDDYRQVSTYAELLEGIRGDRALHDAIDQNLIRVTRAGDLVPDWAETGLDMDVVLDTASGGAAGSVFMLERPGELSFASRHAMHEFFGAEYTTYPILGTAASFEGAQDDRSVTLTEMGEGIWLETLTIGDKIGNASCASNGANAARLYTKRPFASLGKLEKSKIAAYVAGAQRNDVRVCSVGEGDGATRWRLRYFLPEGRRLPVFDRESPRMKLVSRTELGRIIAGS